MRGVADGEAGREAAGFKLRLDRSSSRLHREGVSEEGPHLARRHAPLRAEAEDDLHGVR